MLGESVYRIFQRVSVTADYRRLDTFRKMTSFVAVIWLFNLGFILRGVRRCSVLSARRRSDSAKKSAVWISSEKSFTSMPRLTTPHDKKSLPKVARALLQFHCPSCWNGTFGIGLRRAVRYRTPRATFL